MIENEVKMRSKMSRKWPENGYQYAKFGANNSVSLADSEVGTSNTISTNTITHDLQRHVTYMNTTLNSARKTTDFETILYMVIVNRYLKALVERNSIGFGHDYM